MNKKIIAIAIATAMAAPVAMADMKIYGAFGGDLVNTSAGFGSAEDTTSAVTAMEDNGASQMNFAVTSGSAYGKFAYNMGPATPNGSPAYRDYYLGYNFSGGSSAQFGKMAGAAKNIEKDSLIATFLQTRGTFAEARTGGAYGSSSFISNLIQYKMKAGAANITIQFDPTDNNAASTNEGHTGVAVTGKAGGVNYWGSYNNGQGSEAGQDDSNMKVGASMKFGAVKASLNYTSADDNGATSNAIAITGDMKLGNGLSALATFATTTADAGDGTFTRIAVIKSIGPKARLYAGYASNAPEVGDADTSIGAGMSIKF